MTNSVNRPLLHTLPMPVAERVGWPWTEASQAPALIGDWPTVSIITPSYNQGAYIEETIRSVLLQGYPNLEYFVIDGGSTDGTLDILRLYEPWLHWLSEPDNGQADAINKGLRLATGDILAYLNSDDTYLPAAVEIVTERFRSNPAVGLVYGDCYAVDAHGQPYGLIKGHPFDVRRMIMRGEFVPQQAAFWSRQTMGAVGMFDTNLHFCMDHDYFIRIGQRFPGDYVAQPLANFRFHGSSKTMSLQEKHWRESMSVSQRYGMTRLTAWYWIRVLRHRSTRILPEAVARYVRYALNRPQDPVVAQRRMKE